MAINCNQELLGYDIDFSQKLLIYGCGGHSKVVSEVAESVGFKDIFHFDPKNNQRQFMGRSIIEKCSENYQGYFFIAIGDNFVREKIFKEFLISHKSSKSLVLVHPSSFVSRTSSISEGTIIMPLAVINSSSNIGKGVIINTSCVVEHDTKLNNFSSLAPNSSLGGNSIVGERTAISIGANVKHGIKIGNDVIVGASSCVLNDIGDNIVCHGVPAKIIRSREKGEKYL